MLVCETVTNCDFMLIWSFIAAAKLLLDASTLGTVFDSSDRYPPPECIAGTCEDVITQIIEAVTGNGSSLCWLNGMTSSGKSAVVQSLAEIFASKCRLAGSFFFSRAMANHHNAQHFFPTITFQLSVSVPSLRPFILEVLEHDPSILLKAPHYQFKDLIIDPFLQLPQPLLPPMVVVVDALDECEDQCLVRDMIEQISEVLVKFDLPLCFLFTSRPEPHIRAKFITGQAAAMTCSFTLHEFDAHNDIQTFLWSFLDRVYADRRPVMRSHPQLWPTDHDIEVLVRWSSGLFIFASTVLKYINDKSHNPIQRLKEFVNTCSLLSLSTYTDLDLLYSQILSSVSDIPALNAAIGTIICLFNPLSIEKFEDLLGWEDIDTSLVLEGLNSILLIPEDRKKLVQIFHELFCNFIISDKHSNPYAIDISQCHTVMAEVCLILMATELVRCDGDIETLESTCCGILQYACEYWAAHLSRACISDVLLERLKRFRVEGLLPCIQTSRLSNHLNKVLRSCNWMAKEEQIICPGCQYYFIYNVRLPLILNLIAACRYLIPDIWAVSQCRTVYPGRRP